MTMFNGMRRTSRRHYIENYEFSPALHRKLRDEFGDAHQADIALEGLRAWYLTCLYADGALIGMPSKAVDEAWHEMILMTRDYTEFCRRAFGRYLHHLPDTTLDLPMHQLHEHTLRIVDDHELPLTLFTADADAGLEDGYTWSRSDLTRMRRATEDWQTKKPHRRRRGDRDIDNVRCWDLRVRGGGFFGGDSGGAVGTAEAAGAAGVADAEAAARAWPTAASREARSRPRGREVRVEYGEN